MFFGISRRSARRLLAAACLISVNGVAFAAGTPAGTVIPNTAQVTYTVSGETTTTNSNTVSVVVNEIIEAVVTLQSPAVPAAPGASQQELVFLLTNTGNASETFRLLANSVLTGDDFDPIPTSPSIYFDTDGSGDLSAADTPYISGSNDPVLAPDASVTILVVNDIPTGLLNGQRGRSSLTATSLTGTGTPGQVYPGGSAPGVDAIIGNSGGQDEATGEYVIGDVALGIVLSQLVADPYGGASAVPGSTITYTSVVTPSGSSTAGMAAWSNAVPQWTTYVPGSLRLNGTPLTDAADADAGEYVASPTPQVRVVLGDLTTASGPQTIVYRVTIN